MTLRFANRTVGIACCVSAAILVLGSVAVWVSLTHVGNATLGVARTLSTLASPSESAHARESTSAPLDDSIGIVDKQIKRLIAAGVATRSLRADYIRESRTTTGVQESCAGTIEIDRSSRGRWTCEKPRADGSKPKALEPSNLGSLQTEMYQAVSRFLLPDEDLQRDYRFESLELYRKVLDRMFVLKATPTALAPRAAALIVYVDQDTARVRRVTVLESDGHWTAFTLSNALWK